MDIRPRRDTDIGTVLALARRVHGLDRYPPRGPIDRGSFAAPPQELAAWVAEHEDRVVGHAALHATGVADSLALAANHAHRQPDELAVVARVLVCPSTRRQGVGRALLDTAAADARARGLHPILDVATHLRAAITLYESCGWDRAGAITIHFDDEPSLRCYVYVAPNTAAPPTPGLTRL
jgi:GNAT superfamily N-acetyltransferase